MERHLDVKTGKVSYNPKSADSTLGTYTISPRATMEEMQAKRFALNPKFYTGHVPQQEYKDVLSEECKREAISGYCVIEGTDPCLLSLVASPVGLRSPLTPTRTHSVAISLHRYKGFIPNHRETYGKSFDKVIFACQLLFGAAPRKPLRLNLEYVLLRLCRTPGTCSTNPKNPRRRQIEAARSVNICVAP